METQAQFDAAEQRWRAQLQGRSLVVEADAIPEEARDALTVIGRTYRQQGDQQRKSLVLRRYRAAFLVGVCSVATLYNAAGLWPYLENYFGPLGQTDHKILSDAFRDALDAFGLARFHFPRRNVDEMLMHGGIPGPRTDEYIELLARRSALSDGLDGRQFCQWVAGLTWIQAQQHGLDAPTWRFLSEGREVAEDVVDRSLELLDRFAVATVTVADLTAFPAVMHADLLRALDELSEKQLPVRRRRRDQVDLVPRFSFSPVHGLQVRLPSVEHVTDSPVDWAVAAEGRVGRIRVQAPWPGDPVEPHFVPINRPVKQLALTAQPADQTWIVDVIDPDDPLLVFDGQSGEWIPARNSLPKADVWIAFPNPDDRLAPELIERQGDSSTFDVIDAPLGWDGWTFARISLRSVTALRRSGGDRWRYISSAARPQIEVGDPVAMARTVDGARIFAERPTVFLPPTAQTEGPTTVVEWAVSVARSDGLLLGTRTVDVGRIERRIDLPVPQDTQLVGEFDIRVRGPLGRGMSRRVTVIDDIEVDSSTSFRLMSPGGDGLADAEITVTAPSCDPARIQHRLGTEQVAQRIELTTSEIVLPIFVEIPSMRVAVLSDQRPRESHSSVNLDLEDLPSNRLQVSFGSTGSVSLAALKQGELLQTVNATASGSTGIAVFNLAQLSETLTRSGGAALVVSVRGERIRVAQVRRKQLISGAHRDGDEIVLEDLAADEPLEVAMYRRYAPWLHPAVVNVEAGRDRFVLPSELDGEGEIRLVVEIDDPWSPRQWSGSYPHRGLNSADVALGELTDARPGIDRGYRAWLKRTGSCPRDVASLAFAVELYTSPELGKYRTPQRDLQHELARAIAPSVEHLPAAFSRTAVEEQPIDLFIDSSAILLPPGHYPHGDDLWDASPLLALLATSGARSGDMDDDGQIERVLGGGASAILGDGNDPAGSVGRFGPNEEWLSRLPEDRIDAIWRTANPIPDRLLDSTTRQIAAKQLFDGRRRIVAGFADAEVALVGARRVLEAMHGPSAWRPVDARASKPGWTNLPAYSIAFALVARAAARGDAAAVELHKITRETLVSIARAAPAFVEQDLILAELWMNRWSTR